MMFRVCYVNVLGAFSLEQQVKYLHAFETPETHSFIFSGNGRRKETKQWSNPKLFLFRNYMVPNDGEYPMFNTKTKLVNQISEP